MNVMKGQNERLRGRKNHQLVFLWNILHEQQTEAIKGHHCLCRTTRIIGLSVERFPSRKCEEHEELIRDIDR